MTRARRRADAVVTVTVRVRDDAPRGGRRRDARWRASRWPRRRRCASSPRASRDRAVRMLSVVRCRTGEERGRRGGFRRGESLGIPFRRRRATRERVAARRRISKSISSIKRCKRRRRRRSGCLKRGNTRCRNSVADRSRTSSPVWRITTPRRRISCPRMDTRRRFDNAETQPCCIISCTSPRLVGRTLTKCWRQGVPSS